MSRTARVAAVPRPTPRAAGIVPTLVTNAWPSAVKSDAQAAGRPSSTDDDVPPRGLRRSTWGDAVQLRPDRRSTVVRPAVRAGHDVEERVQAAVVRRPPRSTPAGRRARPRHRSTMPYSGSASANPRAASRAARSAGAVDGPIHHVAGTDSRARSSASIVVDPRLDRRVRSRHVEPQDVVQALERPAGGHQRRRPGPAWTSAPGSHRMAAIAATRAASDSVKRSGLRPRRRLASRPRGGGGTPRRPPRRGPGPSGTTAQPSSNRNGVASRPLRCGLSSTPYSRNSSSEAGERVGLGRQARTCRPGRDAERVVRRVGHRRDRVDRREIGDPERLGDAAADHRLRLDDVDGAPGEQLDRLAPRLHDLAAGERDVEGRRQVLVAGVAARAGASAPRTSEAERVEDVAHLDRPRHRVAGVAVGHQQDAVRQVRADRLEQRRLVGDRVPPDPELHRGEARLEDRARRRPARCRPDRRPRRSRRTRHTSGPAPGPGRRTTRRLTRRAAAPAGPRPRSSSPRRRTGARRTSECRWTVRGSPPAERPIRTGATASMIEGMPGTRYVSPQPERPSASVTFTRT